MRYLAYSVSVFLFLSYTNIAVGADINGYNSQYECRAGGHHCNVDVATLAKRTCDQTISPSTPWASIQWSNNTICLDAGDHTWKGTLTIPSSASGSANNFKILRYTRPNDNDDEPWHQFTGDRVNLWRLILDGAKYWVVQRVSFPPNRNSTDSINLRNGATDNIINRVLVEGNTNGIPIDGGIMAWEGYPADRLTIQNSVIRHNAGISGSDPDGIDIEGGTDVHIVNNEVYDYSSHPVKPGHNGGPLMPGLVIENNDVYFSGWSYTSGGALMRAENPVEIKAGGTSTKPVQVIQNRIWGARWSDTSQCCIGGTGGVGIAIVPPSTGGHEYVLINRNIIFESQNGITWSNGNSPHQYVSGNLFFRIGQFYSGANSHAIEFIKNTDSKLYLNTIIGAGQYGISFGAGRGNAEIFCNVLASAGNREGGTPDSATQVGYNAFYDSRSYAFNGDSIGIDKTISTRINTTVYSADQVIRTSTHTDCTSKTDAACFLYKVTAPGISGSSAPSYCTTLGCITFDGSMTVQAIRGPYTFNRKLKTNPEQYVIPYAQIHQEAPEAYACPSSYNL